MNSLALVLLMAWATISSVSLLVPSLELLLSQVSLNASENDIGGSNQCNGTVLVNRQTLDI